MGIRFPNFVMPAEAGIPLLSSAAPNKSGTPRFRGGDGRVL